MMNSGRSERDSANIISGTMVLPCMMHKRHEMTYEDDCVDCSVRSMRKLLSSCPSTLGGESQQD
jgi:hypothetical protein